MELAALIKMKQELHRANPAANDILEICSRLDELLQLVLSGQAHLNGRLDRLEAAKLYVEPRG